MAITVDIADVEADAGFPFVWISDVSADAPFGPTVDIADVQADTGAGSTVKVDIGDLTASVEAVGYRMATVGKSDGNAQWEPYDWHTPDGAGGWE